MSKTIFITGASSGIGEATAKLLATHGWNVVITARGKAKLNEIAKQIGGDKVLAVKCDVTDYDSLEAAVKAGAAKFGRIDAVFANAGTGGQSGGFSEAPRESWEAIVNVNILGLAYTLQATLPQIKAQKGHVVITGSIAGRRSLDGSMYSASKHAANAIGYNLRGELKGTGARVTVIEPGMVDTPFFDDPKPDALRPDDVARSVHFALSQPETVDLHELVILPTPPQD
ncbi:SDR family oxidoreductase [Robiginitomaculum antarcticum]|uniref:SDR family oxidoreductase n=1 Tax=Robiginitomaculum antarcticum TaxID=437507 RepID=UPI00037BF878|nr:SDR family oxidoreductase [Robiginitomaculum antarcticum]